METDLQIIRTMESLAASMRQSMREFNQENGDAELFNISVTQLHYLHAIKQLQGPTYSRLAEKFGVQKPTVTEIVNRLIQRRLVYNNNAVEICVLLIFFSMKTVIACWKWNDRVIANLPAKWALC